MKNTQQRCLEIIGQNQIRYVGPIRVGLTASQAPPTALLRQIFRRTYRVGQSTAPAIFVESSVHCSRSLRAISSSVFETPGIPGISSIGMLAGLWLPSIFEMVGGLRLPREFPSTSWELRRAGRAGKTQLGTPTGDNVSFHRCREGNPSTFLLPGSTPSTAFSLSLLLCGWMIPKKNV